jgi:GntR family transcriptional regulator, rspAB operon transcriptional repressor
LTYQFPIRDSGFTVPPTSLGAGKRSESVSLSEKAYHIIRERILKGDMALGAPLSRRRLAAELGMSLLPVAEALQTLENDGLVESRPRVGTRVCFPTADEIRERYQIREALESQAARLYAERVTPRQKRELERMAEHMDGMFDRCASATHPDRDSLYAAQSYHLELHLKIAEFAECQTLRAMIEKNHVLIFNWLFDVAASRPALPPRFHRGLIEALNRGKPEVADKAMRAHVRHGLEEIVEMLGPRSKNLRFERVK